MEEVVANPGCGCYIIVVLYPVLIGALRIGRMYKEGRRLFEA